MMTAERFWDTLPHCCGYPKCDGDLEATPHSKECPLFGKKEMDPFMFANAYAADLTQRLAASETRCENLEGINKYNREAAVQNLLCVQNLERQLAELRESWRQAHDAVIEMEKECKELREREKAQIAAAFEDAKRCICHYCQAAAQPNSKWSPANSNGKHFQGIREAYCNAYPIGTRTPADAKAALDARDATSWRRGYDEAKALNSIDNVSQEQINAQIASAEARGEIRGLRCASKKLCIRCRRDEPLTVPNEKEPDYHRVSHGGKPCMAWKITEYLLPRIGALEKQTEPSKENT